MNLAILIGRMVKNPELKYTKSGKAVANFSLAVNRKFNREETDFINCVAWGKTAEIVAEYLRKGSRVGIEGNIRVNKYEKDGQKRYKTEVYIDNLEFLENKNKNGNSDTKKVVESNIDEEEFPF